MIGGGCARCRGKHDRSHAPQEAHRRPGTKTVNSPLVLAKSLGIDLSPSDLVTVDRTQLQAVAGQIRDRNDFREGAAETWADATFWNVEYPPSARSQYLTIGNSINFRFWCLRDSGRIHRVHGFLGGEEYAGALYMWRALRRALDGNVFPLLDAESLARITQADFQRIFKDDDGENPMVVGEEDRIENLRDLGATLIQDWGGQFFNLVKASGGSLARFAEASRRFRAFDDPVFKLTMVNAVLHSGSGLAQFDESPLPGIDYHLVKQLLRTGILRPAREIASKVAAYHILSGQEAYELRRSGLRAMLLLSDATGIPGEVLDNRWWWNRLRCTDNHPVCFDPDTAEECPFFGACARHTGYQTPLEWTRYY